MNLNKFLILLVVIFVNQVLLESVYSQNSVEELYTSKQYTEAFDLGVKQLKKSPKDLNLLKVTAKSATELLLDKEGLDLYNRALKVSSKDPEIYYLLGLHSGKFARRNEEVEFYGQALKLKNDFYEVYSPYAYAYTKLSYFNKSDSLSTIALKHFPNDFKAKFTKGISIAYFGKHQESRQALRELLAIQPHNREVLMNLGILEENQNNFTEAMKRYEKILEFEPKDLDAKMRIGVVYFKLGLKSESKVHLAKVLKEYPNEVRLLRTLADLEMSQGNIMAGKELYSEILTLDSNNPQSYLNMFEVYSQLGLFDSSVKILNTGIEKIPNNTGLLMDLGQVLGNSNKIKEAIKVYKKVEKIQPNNVKCLFNLSIAYFKSGFTEEALNYVDKAIYHTTSKDSASYYYRMKAEIMLSKRDYDEAIRIFQKVIEFKPTDEFAWYNLGIIYINKNNQIQAKIHLEKALEINPHFVECRKVYIRYLVGAKMYDEALTQCELMKKDDPFAAEDYKLAITELLAK